MSREGCDFSRTAEQALERWALAPDAAVRFPSLDMQAREGYDFQSHRLGFICKAALAPEGNALSQSGTDGK
jgi:hypothetical protein